MRLFSHAFICAFLIAAARGHSSRKAARARTAPPSQPTGGTSGTARLSLPLAVLGCQFLPRLLPERPAARCRSRCERPSARRNGPPPCPPLLCAHQARPPRKENQAVPLMFHPLSVELKPLPSGGCHVDIMPNLSLLLCLLLLLFGSPADTSAHEEQPDFFGVPLKKTSDNPPSFPEQIFSLNLAPVSPAGASFFRRFQFEPSDEAAGYGPIFEEQPVDTIYPEESPEDKITMICRARASPPATYKWILDGAEIDLSADRKHYALSEGNLVISEPVKNKHEGRYSCLAGNTHGTVVSREASVQFGYLDLFSSEERESVYVKEGQGAVLLCAPPPHHPADLSFRWILNEFPTFIPPDKRRFISQITGNLYISKVEASDSGNYSCIASSASISKSVFSNYIPLVPLTERAIRKYPADLNVKFPDTTTLAGHNITLECFALGNPVPEIRWRKLNGELPPNHEVRMAGAHLHLYNVRSEDSGSYQCEAANSKGKDYHSAHLSVEAFPEWVEHISSAERDLGSAYTMSCLARGKPKPRIRWLKNGEPLDGKEMVFRNLTFEDSGMYQCIAENPHGVIFANAELRVFDCAPTFERNPVKHVLAPRNGRVVMECRPKAAPKPKVSWSKDTELLSNSSRMFIWEDGSLEILNVTRTDEGRYTCFAHNNLGKANSTGSLTVTDSTKITLAPSNADVKVGENARMQCGASHDSSLDIAFIWSLDGRVIDLDKDAQHYERTLNGSSDGELLIKNAQLKHAGIYSCTAQTPVDNVTSSASLVVRGPPGAPAGLRVTDKSNKNVTLQWSRGADNHSPISKYTIQYRDGFSRDVWKNAATSPADIEGNAETATVVDLVPWTEYEFRVIATNTLGTGTPSVPSLKEKTLASSPVVAPSDVGGGGGTNRELTITWTPVQEQYYYGPYFGYIVAFKPRAGVEWTQVTVSDPRAGRYVHRDPSIAPATEFVVKIQAYNSKGEGPYSLPQTIFSAQDAITDAPGSIDGKALSATEAVLWWFPISQSNIDGYQVKYWRKQEDSEGGAHKVVVSGKENHTRVDGMKPDSLYLIEIRGYNSAGYGPASERLEIHTKKPPPGQAPRIISKKLKGKSVNVAWEHVETLANEAPVDGYKVLYRPQGQSTGTLYMTKWRHIELPLFENETYVVEVRAYTEGGDGAVSQIFITGGSATAARPLSALGLLLVAVLCLNL
ncbi:contactin-1a isoform X2 [Syngnathoides biaculeatus]|uniref:contactin-1a isoform X2 n=1 Tax=Syngnathoides biaculeatus TaxID=300417 RepID=UPI002ADE31F1|nr:contactin-1a isoform X2 [Syngnathoides biaculeatus]